MVALWWHCCQTFSPRPLVSTCHRALVAICCTASGPTRPPILAPYQFAASRPLCAPWVRRDGHGTCKHDMNTPAVALWPDVFTPTVGVHMPSRTVSDLLHGHCANQTAYPCSLPDRGIATFVASRPLRATHGIVTSLDFCCAHLPWQFAASRSLWIPYAQRTAEKAVRSSKQMLAFVH